MPKKKQDDKIEPIEGNFDNVTKAVVKSEQPKEITPSSNQIKNLPQNSSGEEITDQMSFDFRIDCQTETHGIGMGVLRDGTPFLNQRGLARLCGVQNAHIGTISTQWNEYPIKPRIAKIKELLASRGVFIDNPHVEASDGKNILYAYPDAVCLAVLEYYAFEAGNNCQEDARNNFRLLAGRALQDFIYAQVGYDPNYNLPEKWRQFHDRVSSTYDAVPAGYFSVFKEIADMIVTLGQNGLHIDESFVPDISVGQHWASHWKENNLAEIYGDRIQYEHNYPEYFPQADANPQPAYCYPEKALGEFRRWMREHYIGQGKFQKYLQGQVKKKALPASFAQLAIEAYTAEDKQSLSDSSENE